MTITPIQLSEILGKNKLGVEFINKKTASLNEVFEKFSTPVRMLAVVFPFSRISGWFRLR